MKVLVCGGAGTATLNENLIKRKGYIGSHLVREISKLDDYQVVVFDNLSKGHKEAVPSTAEFEEGDIRNKADLERVFSKHKPDAVFVRSLLI